MAPAIIYVVISAAITTAGFSGIWIWKNWNLVHTLLIVSFYYFKFKARNFYRKSTKGSYTGVSTTGTMATGNANINQRIPLDDF